MADAIPKDGWSTTPQAAPEQAPSNGGASSVPEAVTSPTESVPQSGWSVPQTGWKVPPAPGKSSSGIPDSGWAPPEKPTPVATPHTYDNYISKAAKESGIDPRILQAVGMQESGLGKSGNFDEKTGLDKDGNAGHGIFQLDPASGATSAELARAAKNPQYAAARAAQMIANNMKTTHGDIRGALAMYNAGSATSPAGLAYANEVLRQQEQDEPLIEQHSTVAKLQHDYKTVTKQVAKGKPLGQALARTETFKPLHDVEVKGALSWDWIRRHPATSALNAIGSLQHVLGGFEYDSANHPDLKDAHGKPIPFDHATFKQKLQHVMDYALNPTDKQNEKSTKGAGDVINRFASEHGHKGNLIPSHSQIDSYVRGQTRTPKSLKPLETTLLKMGSDFGQQTISDPFVVDSLAHGLGTVALHGIGAVSKAVHAVASGMGIAQHFTHLPLIHEAVEGAKDIFVARRDLDRAGLTSTGKQVRIAIENKHLNAAQPVRERLEASKGSAGKMQREYLQTVYEHGTRKKSDEAARLLRLSPHAGPSGSVVAGKIQSKLADIRGAKPDERVGIVSSLHNQVVKKFANNETSRLVASRPDMFTGNAQDLDKLSLKDNSEGMRALRTLEKGNPLTHLAELGKKSILWNPMPHGLVNVGTLAYQAGGIEGVMRGFQHMISPGKTSAAALHDLESMGAMQKYSNTATTAVGKGSNAVLERMEVGWRLGLKDILDKKLGPSTPGSVEHYLKGAMINNHIGDYRNISAFTQFFKSLGGPFVAFRLGIVPEQFMKTLIAHPGRIEQPIRAEQDIQDNRSAKKRNELEFGGPTPDALKLLTDPRKFFAARSTSGGLGEYLSGNDQIKGGMIDTAIDIAKSYIPGLEDLGNIYQAASGASMPGQKMSLADKLASIISEELLNVHVKAQEKAKVERANEKRIKKQVTE